MTEEVLLLDDDLTTLTFLEGVLSGAGFKCSVSGDPQEALATVAAREEIAVVVSDLYMPHMSGSRVRRRPLYPRSQQTGAPCTASDSPTLTGVRGRRTSQRRP